MAKDASRSNTVEYLFRQSRLEQISSSDLGATSEALRGRARLRLRTARAALDGGDIDGAFVAAYDAYRIAAESLLVLQGLRATGGEGSHVTVEDAVSSQFADEIAAFAKPTFERFRRSRHAAQYFDPTAPELSADDAGWAIETASKAVDGAESVSATNPPQPFAPSG